MKPRAVIPKREFDGLEVGTVGKAARIPGERLGAVIVRIEFVDAEPVVGRGRKPDDDRGAQQRHSRDDFRIERKAAKCTLCPPTREYRQSSTSMAPATNAQPAYWCPRPTQHRRR